MIVLADTSALFKLYIDEEGSDAMALFVRDGDLAASMLAFAEVHATFARRLRDGLLSQSEYDVLLKQFEMDWNEIVQIPLDAHMLSSVPLLCMQHTLRGADAVHLSAADVLCNDGIDVTFACADAKLVAAAHAVGVEVFNPLGA